MGRDKTTQTDNESGNVVVHGIRNKRVDDISPVKMFDNDITLLIETKEKSWEAEESEGFVNIYSGAPKEDRAKREVGAI